MGEIADLKECFVTEDVYAVYAACMFEPTWEKFRERAERLLQDSAVRMFGYREENRLVGVVVVRISGNTGELCGIAVADTRRGRGIGRTLVRYIMDGFCPALLTAETDDDAIGFYRNCGFVTEEFTKLYDSGVCRRYRCMLRKDTE